MLRLSKLTDYAIVLLSEIARAGDSKTVFAVACLSRKTGVPEPTVAKILKLLAKGGLLSSQRGVTGGYSLTRSAHAITMADIVAALEGPIALTECVGGHSGDCAVEHVCSLRGNWDKINSAVYSALESVTLADMAFPIPAAFMIAEPHAQRGLA